jgi:hypothetical protein
MMVVDWPVIAGLALYMGVEYWLGRTDKVKAGSALEAVLLTVKAIVAPKKPKGLDLPK